MPLTITMHPSEHSLGAIALLVGPTLLASTARVCNRLETGTHANLKILARTADLDDYPRAFMACAFCAVIAHFPHPPIGNHHVNIRMADAGRVEFDENIFWA